MSRNIWANIWETSKAGKEKQEIITCDDVVVTCGWWVTWCVLPVTRLFFFWKFSMTVCMSPFSFPSTGNSDICNRRIGIVNRDIYAYINCVIKIYMSIPLFVTQIYVDKRVHMCFNCALIKSKSDVSWLQGPNNKSWEAIGSATLAR